MKSNYILIAILIIVLAAAGYWFATQGSMMTSNTATTTATTTTTADTNTTGTPGNTTATPALSSKVHVVLPQPNQSVDPIFSVSGEAPGPWFFEGSFPVQIRDKSNNILQQATAKALGTWTTEGQVKFAVSITVTQFHGPATVILLRDNPSGMPENDDSVSIPITIK
ncbi:MAG: hypothetical protein JWO50_287 [Candidatus Kaiserbacteria bacterium]|nr:hypothetical protein [Candidatus Kaiserbacteria bacterium]